MIPVLLIAQNFLREQRWLTVLLVFYAVAGAAVFAYGEKRVPTADLLFFVKQQALYAILFSVFLAASAIHNERKTRRILAVLSKAVERRQYLAGLLAGTAGVFATYCLAIGLAGSWLMRNSGLHLRELWILLGAAAAASLLTAAITLFFTTFLNPLFATAATALVIATPAALEHALGHGWGNVLPVYAIATTVSKTALAAGHGPGWELPAIAVLETIALWVAASWVFERRDITVALE